jgi:hypothetical protein
VKPRTARESFPKRTVWWELIVIVAPSFDLGSCIFRRQEPVYVPALISKVSLNDSTTRHAGRSLTSWSASRCIAPSHCSARPTFVLSSGPSTSEHQARVPRPSSSARCSRVQARAASSLQRLPSRRTCCASDRKSTRSSAAVGTPRECSPLTPFASKPQ